MDLVWQLALIILAVKSAGLICRKLKQPEVLGKLLAGVILGPSILNLLTVTGPIKAMAELGVILLMFLAGLETELKRFRETGKASAFSALGGIVLPLAGGLWLALSFDMSLKAALFVGITLTATSVSISVQTLREMGKLQSKEGTTIMGAAVIDDILGIIMLSLLLGAVAGADSDDLVFLVAKIFIFFIAVFLVAKWILPPLLQLVERVGVHQGFVPLSISICLLLAYFSDLSGLATITGAYLAGIIMNQLGYTRLIYEKIDAISYNFFVPVFLVSIGLGIQISDLGGSIPFVLALTAMAVITKVLGGGLGAMLGGFPVSNSVAVGTGLVSRGEIALIVASLGLNKGLISGDIFASIVAMVLLTTMATPLFLKMTMKNIK
ncbi:Kef-type K+ transport system membrane component KefB [Desulfitispora alkaliphila]|uniref:cation:proton antiporter n=1 Tax=Desulfitispora alkaliphila TaxID=622674 RepID=UPI003D1B7215